MLHAPEPIMVVDLFPETLDALLALLRGLSPEEWERPTVCGDWTVKDVAAHLLGGDVGVLSRGRDRYTPGGPLANYAELVALINNLNAQWVQATRRLSPRLLCDLLAELGAQVNSHFRTLAPLALGGPVDWAGPEPAPIWLDLAREYTERWLHQQHIRAAVGRPGLVEPRFLAPVLAAYVYALPRAYQGATAAEGTAVALTISGAAGGRWTLRREAGQWRLFQGIAAQPATEVTVDGDAAWRLFTKGLSPEEARQRVQIAGDRALGEHVLAAVAIIG